MAKEAYYFSHDSNAQDDPKCMLLIDQLGMEGYGIFWALIERLRNEKDYRLPVNLANAFAKRWYTSKEKVESVINNYGLFGIENGFFFSERLKSSMILKSEKARESANYRWGNATALLPNSDRIATGMRKDASKEKEKKEKEKNNNKNIPDVGFGGFAPLPPSVNFFPKADNFNGIPNQTKSDLKKLVLSTKHIEIDDDQIESIWSVFKNQNLTGVKPYRDEQDIYRHFINWGVKQSFRKKTTKRDRTNIKSYEVFGVEFTDDFAKCRMNNGTTVELSRNESDSARYGQINPSSIKR